MIGSGDSQTLVIGDEATDLVPDAERSGQMQRIEASQICWTDRSSLVEYGIIERQQCDTLQERSRLECVLALIACAGTNRLDTQEGT